jgi:hypothetical protein
LEKPFHSGVGMVAQRRMLNDAKHSAFTGRIDQNSLAEHSERDCHVEQNK